MDIQIVEMNKKIVQIDIKIEPINFVHDHDQQFKRTKNSSNEQKKIVDMNKKIVQNEQKISSI